MTGTFIAYPAVSDAVNKTDNQSVSPMVSHAYGQVFMMNVNQDTGGFRRWDAWPNGNELAVGDLTTIMSPPNGVQTPWCFGFNHNTLAACDQNGDTIVTMAQRNFANMGNVPKNPGDPYHTPQQMTSISANGDDVFICTSVTNTFGITAISYSESRCTAIATMTTPHGILGSYPDGSGSFFCAAGIPVSDTAGVPLYTGNAGSAELVGTLNPSDIDPTWNHITYMYGIIIDQTDDNPMMLVGNGTDAGVQPYYLIKWSATTGALLWTSALPGANNFEFHNMRNTLVKNQTIYYISTTKEICTINTADGTFTTQPFSQGVLDGAAGSQVSEDVVGSVYFKGTWSEVNTHPNYAGTYMGVDGNHTISDNTTMRYFPNLSAPVVPAPLIMATSRQRAWTFTLDGHKFYVLDLGDQGTLLYDTTTSSWSQFITTGYNNWNFRNGTMWDQRIVAGDTDTQQIWEMAPSYMLDNGTTPIEHITTGGLVKRNRVFISCAALRLNVSVGQLDENGATVLLEFSDDQGKTWTEMDLLSLVDGDYDAELAWQGLGSFAAPGRVFRITDVGGFIRIDGCDAELGDFDEDNNSQTQEQG